MPWAVSFVGPHNAGKTTLLASLVRELVRRGLRVGFLKSSKETMAERERDGSDTVRLKEAGAQPTAFWGQEELLVSTKAPFKADLEFWGVIGKYFSTCDLVISEGFKGLLSLPKIGVFLEEEMTEIPGLIALIGEKGRSNLPFFTPHEIEPLADFILALKPKYESLVHLVVDGQPVSLTRFVSQALAGTILGFISSLRGVREPSSIQINLKLPKD